MPESKFLKAEKVVATNIGLLRRELVIPRLIYRDGALGDATLAKNDTVSIRLPAYAPARRRVLRSGTARVKDQIHERKVDVTLDVDVYKDIGISDEQLSLDISDFGAQVSSPVVLGVAEQLEQECIDVIEGAAYNTVLTHTLSTDDAYNTVLNARQALNDARVPQSDRTLLVGSAFENAILKNPNFRNVDQSGTDSVLRDAVIGKIAGFTVVTAPGLAPTTAYAFHKTAYAMVQRAPIVPAGAPWGATSNYEGFAIRTVRVFDPDAVEDRFIVDSWIGCDIVPDDGYYDAYGRFVPTVEPGVTLGYTSSITATAATDVVNLNGHKMKVGDKVQFASLAGGAGLSNGTQYYVIASGLTNNAFKVSTTANGAAVDITTDYTGGTVAKVAAPAFVRSVKINVV